mmetsp:Transcript_44093/g.99637  ORF Transcript_44093/g.99637 Transcript_44093/m.99637 type:complete len:127 (+) Transcript_44093:88-468(+)
MYRHVVSTILVLGILENPLGAHGFSSLVGRQKVVATLTRANPLDDLQDYLEGKAGYTGFTEKQLTNYAGDRGEGIEELSYLFDEGPNKGGESISNALIAFLFITPLMGAFFVRAFLIPDNLEVLNL